MRGRRTFKDLLVQMRETRAGRHAIIGLTLWIGSALLGVAFEHNTVRWISVILFVWGGLAFIFGGLNIIGIEVDFMPRFLRSREK